MPLPVETGSRRINILTDTVRRLIRRHATVNLVKIIKKTHEADLALIFKNLSRRDGLLLFELLPNPEVAADVLSEMEMEVRSYYLEVLDPERLANIFQEMSPDDAAAIMEEIADEGRRTRILELMKEEDSDEVEELLSYGENTAGRIMSPDFLALPQNMDAGEAIRQLRKASEAEMVFYVYVVNEDGRLVGVVSLRELVTRPPETLLANIMNPDVVRVEAHEDQEEVATLVAHYNILAIPVVDEAVKMVGIITVDDVIDVMRDEATEDILKMVGTREEDITTTSAFRSARLRLPWLFVSWIGGVLASQVIGAFDETIKTIPALAAFIPVVVGMGGNIGIQSASITVRGLATGRVEIGQTFRYVIKEVTVGLVLGVAYGVLLGLVSGVLNWSASGFEPLRLGLATGLGIMSSMLLASIMGSALPIFFERLRIDPAIASGPFVTTTIDIVGVTAYFVIAYVVI